jgi:rubrerythrin
MPLSGSQTAAGLRRAFTAEAEAAARMLYFARRADVEGRADVAAVLRAIAEGELGQAFGHLELLEETGDPLTGSGDTEGNVSSVIEAEDAMAATDYPSLANTARAEGFTEVADWFESLAAAEAAHVSQLRRLEG